MALITMMYLLLGVWCLPHKVYVVFNKAQIMHGLQPHRDPFTLQYCGRPIFFV
jgi:hypothetical protein